MAWLPGWSSSSPADSSAKPQPKKGGEYQPPDRFKRAKCWDARDAYFACLDRHNILDALKDADAAKTTCGKETEGFEQNCAASWVKYFKQRRVAEHDREQLLKRQEAESFGSSRR